MNVAGELLATSALTPGEEMGVLSDFQIMSVSSFI
jgi:hypothetical protein